MAFVWLVNAMNDVTVTVMDYESVAPSIVKSQTYSQHMILKPVMSRIIVSIDNLKQTLVELFLPNSNLVT